MHGFIFMEAETKELKVCLGSWVCCFSIVMIMVVVIHGSCLNLNRVEGFVSCDEERVVKV